MAELLLPLSPRVTEMKALLEDFVENHCIPAEATFEEQLGEGSARWAAVPAVMEELKNEARRLGLWNLWLPREFPQGAGLTNAEYAVLAEVTGRSMLAPEACNCSAPDTGNMEVLLRYGTDAQRKRWLEPLLDGAVRSAFLMTEPAVASSDATNIECIFRRLPGGRGYEITGRKWWSSGAMDPRCAVAIVMGRVLDGDDERKWNEEKKDALAKRASGSSSESSASASSASASVGASASGVNDRRRSQQTMLLVPMNSPGVRVVRSLTVFGYDDAPHGHAEVELDHVQVRHCRYVQKGTAGRQADMFRK